jgi:hypothetical protein
VAHPEGQPEENDRHGWIHRAPGCVWASVRDRCGIRAGSVRDRPKRPPRIRQNPHDTTLQQDHNRSCATTEQEQEVTRTRGRPSRRAKRRAKKKARLKADHVFATTGKL